MARRLRNHALWILAMLCGSLPTGVGQDPARVPAIHATTLAGTEVTFPDALKGKLNIVIVGFSHASKEQIANWGRLIAADYGKSTDINYFELAMLAGIPKMMRGVLIKRMGTSVPFEERGHYIPVLDGEPAWRATAHYDKADDAYVLLVDNTGLVLWQTEGIPQMPLTTTSSRKWRRSCDQQTPTSAPRRAILKQGRQSRTGRIR